MPGARQPAGMHRPPSPPYQEPPALEDQDLLLAAAYVSDAQYNRNVPFETSPQAIRLYCFYNHWTMRAATYFFICVDLALAFFEEPAWLPLPFLATSIAEVLCLTVFFGRLVHFAKVTPQMVFWKDTKNICLMVTIVLTLIDLIIYGSLEAVNIRAVRWSRALRPVFLINFPESRQIRRAFRSIRNTLPDILYVFLLFIFSVLIFSLIALKLFGNRGLKTVEGSPYFTNILDITFELYVLVTTANSPDVMMPAYEFSWWYSLFFITYIIINTYIFMSVFLAVVYNNYRKHLKNEIRTLAYLKRHKMLEAFNILKVKVGTEFMVTEAQWRRLVKLVAPDISSSHLELLLRISDEGQKGHVDKTNFLRLADLLNIQVVTVNIRRHPLEAWMPQVYQSSASLLVQKMVRHRTFVWVYDVIILVNAVFIALDEKNPFISYAEWLFLFLYVIEILLKLYTYEPRAYFGRKQFWNWFDTLIIIAALVATVANTTIRSARKYSSQQILDIVLILRILRLLRVIISIQSIFIAFILEAFFVAYSLEKSEVETAIEKKIQELGVGVQEEEMQDRSLVDNVEAKDSGFHGDEGDNKRKALKGLYFRIASKKYRTVDALLQQMFESEIAPEDESPSLEEILNVSPSSRHPRNPSFGNSV
ncbi:two pore calcium channel protein 1-like isoform X2 [Phacochoerus africanus]|uniref:two pore calcium channel protein 1-like isoform X2 n=1 Tax=Phacochoerus africanus TaxID=41426 RepID=UPI001FDA95E8|nr:two pore calcium channel protein 1-like isoform X2 [Phacochoerus africanus]